MTVTPRLVGRSEERSSRISEKSHWRPVNAEVGSRCGTSKNSGLRGQRLWHKSEKSSVKWEEGEKNQNQIYLNCINSGSD